MKTRVGIVDDVRCELHVQSSKHQESPNRIQAIREELIASGLYEKLHHINPVNISEEDLLRVHSAKYIRKVIKCCSYGEAVIGDPDVIVHGKNSQKAIMAAVGSCLAAVESVVSNKVQRAFCNVRPPGHHASNHLAAGFCIFNNIAIAAKYALEKKGIDRIAIIDWDLHRGNGTSEIFAGEEDVLFLSIHRDWPFYPDLGRRSKRKIYKNIFNYPQPEYVSVESYHKDFDALLLKVKKFDPDLIFISCGFDGHKDDLYHALPLDDKDFYEMTRKVVRIANDCCAGKIISVLEGGYDPLIISMCAKEHILALMEP